MKTVNKLPTTNSIIFTQIKRGSGIILFVVFHNKLFYTAPICIFPLIPENSYGRYLSERTYFIFSFSCSTTTIHSPGGLCRPFCFWQFAEPLFLPDNLVPVLFQRFHRRLKLTFLCQNIIRIISGHRKYPDLTAC